MTDIFTAEFVDSADNHYHALIRRDDAAGMLLFCIGFAGANTPSLYINRRYGITAYDEQAAAAALMQFAAESMWQTLSLEFTKDSMTDPFKPIAQAACMCLWAVENGVTYVLASQRAPTITFPGAWQFPGGKVDVVTESMLNGAIREVHEETGLVCSESSVNLLGVLNCPVSGSVPYILAAFERQFTYRQGLPILPEQERDKSSPWEWMTLDEFESRTLIPVIRPVLQLFREKYGQN